MATMQSWILARTNETEGRDSSALTRPTPSALQMTYYVRTEVLIGVLEVDITDGGDDGVAVGSPVEAALLQPLEVRRVTDLLLHQLLRRLLHMFSRWLWSADFCHDFNIGSHTRLSRSRARQSLHANACFKREMMIIDSDVAAQKLLAVNMWG